MISICIPIYNFQVCNLVAELHKQAEQLKIVYEIICIDDSSEKKWVEKNECLNGHVNVRYYQLKSNIGRSKIRNLMAEKSKYDYLLYLDCDSAIISDNFLSKFIGIQQVSNVVYGGRTHGNKRPENNSLSLRWLYGIKREDKTIADRELDPYLSFRSNNFLIHKATFQSIKFNELFKGYGHEDTYFAQELKEKNIPIVHVNNPILHVGLENNEEFLNKTKEGIKNLTHLLNSNTTLINDIRLIKTYKKVKKYKLSFLFKLSHPFLIKFLTKKLLSSNPKLIYLDIYKLTILIHHLK